MEGKKYAIFVDSGKWFVEMQATRAEHWVIAAGPFCDVAKAQEALNRMQYDDVACLDTGEPVIASATENAAPILSEDTLREADKAVVRWESSDKLARPLVLELFALFQRSADSAL